MQGVKSIPDMIAELPPKDKQPVHRLIAEHKLLKAALESCCARLNDLVHYESDEDTVGNKVCCGTVSYKEHANGCVLVNAQKALEAVK